MKNLNRPLILKLALFGPLMGALIVAGTFPEGVEKFAWLPVDIFCAVAIARARVDNAFWHGVVTGFLMGASSTLVQGLFIDSYVANNPWVLERFADQPEGFSIQGFVLQLVPFIGLASALMLGFLSFLADRALAKKGSA